MFLRSLPLCVNLICALSKPAFSLNLHASICCLVAGLQRHHGEHKFNLRWLELVQWRFRGGNGWWRDWFLYLSFEVLVHRSPAHRRCSVWETTGPAGTSSICGFSTWNETGQDIYVFIIPPPLRCIMWKRQHLIKVWSIWGKLWFFRFRLFYRPVFVYKAQYDRIKQWSIWDKIMQSLVVEDLLFDQKVREKTTFFVWNSVFFLTHHCGRSLNTPTGPV